ncbi:MAG TPA: M48 family metalloprotease [Acidobacteriaceae bacterium]|nr:M48 family metalloprotease [Acidobacteriaceae bacterium]
MRRPLVVLAVLSLPCAAHAATPLQVSGYITAIHPSSGFDLQGVHIALTANTQLCIHTPATPSGYTETCKPAGTVTPPSFYIGQTMDAFGRINQSAHTLTADKLVPVPASIASVKGVAIIDLVPATQPTDPKERTIRADGYLLHITAKTKLNLAPPLKSLADVSTNQWIEYSGVQQLDGTVLLDYAGIGPNTVEHTEEKLRKKTEYDPSAVPNDAHQSSISKTFLGVDYKRIPPYHDAAMQARVERIGNSLIPAYQQALPTGDPAKISFRFQVIDEKKWHDAVTLPSGVIVIPHQVIERLQNDDQLATVLADNIAENLEKDTIHMVAVSHKVLAADIAGNVAGAFVPGLGIATDLAGGGAAAHVHKLQLQQSGRVSLCLMHDAGYDINQAPLAWWLLASKKPKPLDTVAIPPRALTLYIALGTTWHAPASPAPIASARHP